MNETVCDKKAHKKADFYRKRILVIQENVKLFTVLTGAVSLVLLTVNLCNAFTGAIAGWVTVLLDVVWLAVVCAYATYAVVSSASKKKCFGKIGEIAYGAFPKEYIRCSAEAGCAYFERGAALRLYEDDRYYYLVADGLDECGAEFWTRYRFGTDFGVLKTEKNASATETDVTSVFGDPIRLRRKSS